MSSMDFQTQKDRALTVLSRHGLARHSAAPPLLLLLWRLGMQVPPPNFMGFGAITLSFGAWFGVIWGAVMWLAVWSRNGTSPLGAAVWAAGAGLCYGLTMAFICSRQRRKHDLPPWESLRDVPGPHGGRSAPLRH